MVEYLLGRALVHVTRLLLPDFSVKVVRHMNWDFYWGELWKKTVLMRWRPVPPNASRGAAADDIPGRKSAR